MDIPRIEQLISEAIENRPRAVNAPLNLYVYNGKIICGTRVVMPKNARFISHITSETIKLGFNAADWKAVIEKAMWILKDTLGGITDDCDFRERRREERLKAAGSIWFTPKGDEITLQGQLVDVSSRGLAFNCYDTKGCPALGRQITARFEVPWFAPQGVVQSRKFTRIAKVCRIDGGNSHLKRIAVQFTEPLPFKPAEQSQLSDADVTVLTAAQN
jgi:hypothetical protein